VLKEARTKGSGVPNSRGDTRKKGRVTVEVLYYEDEKEAGGSKHTRKSKAVLKKEELSRSCGNENHMGPTKEYPSFWSLDGWLPRIPCETSDEKEVTAAYTSGKGRSAGTEVNMRRGSANWFGRKEIPGCLKKRLFLGLSLRVFSTQDSMHAWGVSGGAPRAGGKGRNEDGGALLSAGE